MDGTPHHDRSENRGSVTRNTRMNSPIPYSSKLPWFNLHYSNSQQPNVASMLFQRMLSLELISLVLDRFGCCGNNLDVSFVEL